MRATSDIRALSRRAAAQHGNVTVADLRAAGVAKGERDRLVRQGWLIRRHTGVYAVGHAPTSRESRWAAAVLALGDEAALSMRAAGAYWRLLRGAVPTEVTVPTADGRTHRDGIRVHRMALPAAHVVRRDGLRVTSLLRTILDLAMVLRLHALATVFERAQVEHHLPPATVAAEVVCRRGYRGNARLGRVLDGAVDPAAVRSILELRFLRLCAAHGIPRPLVNEPLGVWTPDFLWPAQGLVVETDGHAFHRTAAARRRDARKDAALHAMGLTVLRLIWADVVGAPLATAARVLDALSGGSRPHGWASAAIRRHASSTR